MGKQKQPRRKHIPQRTCIACRRKTDKRRLTRIVKNEADEVKVDPTGKANGRGAYVCDQPACWDKIIQEQGLLNKALKTEITPVQRERLAAHQPAAATAVDNR